MRRTQREAAADEGCNRMQRRTEKGFANSNCGLCRAAEQSQRNYSTKSEEVARGEQHGERREPARLLTAPTLPSKNKSLRAS